MPDRRRDGTPADAAVFRFREQYRSEEVPAWYNGWLHFAFTNAVGLAAVLLCAWQVDTPTFAEWMTVPGVFIYANLMEYLGHRGPMHHPVRGLRLLYTRHAKQHHRFFTDRHMSFEGSSDFRAVLFPPFMIVFFLGALGLPMWLLLSLLASENVAWLAVATAVAYYLNYEWLHFAYHCDPASRVGRIPGLVRLRTLHLRHHDPRLMTRYNFNITYPIGDLLFGSLRR